MKYLDKLSNRFNNINGSLAAVPLFKIEYYEYEFNVVFPAAFKEYLMNIGQDSGLLFSGSEYCFSEFRSLQKKGKEIYFRAKKKEIPESHFIFLVHQNYSFYSFSLLDGDNPAVYSFIDGDDESNLEITYNSFVLFLDSMISKHIKLTSYLKGK